jgi:hypothetical protein
MAMKAFTKIAAAGIAIAGLAAAAPAAAQYYPGYGYGYPNGGNVVGQVINQVLGGGYGYNSYGGGRVLGISRVEPRSNGGLTVRGVASSGRYAGYGQGQVDLTWKCKVDSRGYVSNIDLNRVSSNYGYGNYSPYNNYDYSQYGYRRY